MYFFSSSENLAYKKSTWQSSTHDLSVSSSKKAVDGLKTNLGYTGGQCSVSSTGQPTATWRVDLGNISSIHNVVIYYRTDNFAWEPSNQYTGRFMGFYLYISNTTNKQEGYLCFHDRNYTTATIPAVANISCPIHGQYVIYYNERPVKNSSITGYSSHAFAELCEVEVYGCSDPRRYGTSCLSICPKNCNKYCHIRSGNCFQCNPGYKGEHCEQECDPGSYGADCNLACGKCADSETCNPINGTCLNGCAEGFFGILCNIENMAYKRLTWQNTSHDLYTGSEKAVDGLKTDLSYAGKQCSISRNEQTTATWWVDLNETRSIRNIIIYYRTDNANWDASNGYTARFLGFYLYVSNSTNRLEGHLCFHDTMYTNATIPAVANLNCSVNGQYVIYYSERLQSAGKPGYSEYAFNELCEVEVYGCSQRRYGTDCSKTCPTHCSKYCNIESGNCLSCKAGYKGARCEQECDGGFYGINCKLRCGNCLNSDYCNAVNGTCQHGCDEGFEGILCDKTCEEGTFGQNCMETCNSTCYGCNRTNGICDSGCQPGWKGDYCHRECDDGFYGVNCSLLCGNCLDSEECHPINGTCINGCDEGFQGILCKETCRNGTFGKNCVEKCNTTCYGCNRTNGKCDYGCHPGWKGDYCHEACENETFGRNCLETCNSTCYGCNRTNGKCENGCYPGWKGDYCHEECDGGFYGDNCSKSCGNCVNSEQCNPFNGICINGCDEGFGGVLCNRSCTNGTFGRNCLETCNTTCYGCNGTNGKCETGCFPGWMGDYCHQECNSGFYGLNCTMKCANCLDMEQCHPVNGTCIAGCNEGFEGILCNKTCTRGTFGRNCLETCNATCYGCNPTNGKCDNECIPGWKGDYCHHECDGGYFGEDCKLKCGNCFNDGQCHNINGSCLNGCAAGYNGTHCTEVCNEGFHGLNCIQECHRCKERYCWPQNGSCVLGLKQDIERDSSQIIGAAVGTVVFVLITAVLLFLVLKRYKKPKDQRKNSKLLPESTENHQFNNVYTNSNAVKELKKKGCQKYNSDEKLNMEELINKGEEKEEIPDDVDDLYMNQLSFSDIPIDQIGATIAEKRENDNEKFRKEYADFPPGELHKCDVGKRSENVPKNRFKTTFPYDHSRVVLRTQDENASDYINANYIDGPNRKKEYIAAQGPKQNTLGDFWTMLWQENISTIVMLTNLREGEKIKCTQYWPDKDKHINYGTVSVKWMEEREYAFFVTRKLKVINKEMKKSRVLTHYHYTAWPDHGTPDPLCLIIFHNHVIRTKSNQNNAPTVVHCSAGVGRTGTYIALDILQQIGSKTGKVNVADCVRKMRENRMTMVQTYEQYITIFLTLQEYFKAPMKVDSVDDINEKIEKSGKDTPLNQSVLHKEFQRLLNIWPIYTEADYKFSKQSCGHKNGILPLDKYNVHLSSYVPKRGSYTNAISVPSFTKPRGFIVTPYPEAENSVDFLRLLNDHECDTVICMDPIAEIQASNEWFPSNSSSKFVPPFMVHCQSHSQTDVTSSTIQIVLDKKEDEAHIVRIVEPTEKMKSFGDSLDTLQLRNLVSAALNTDTENPIVVMSRDGASLCGLLCAIHNVIQQITIDECADIFTAVRQILIRRPEFCTKIEEYKLIYKAVNDYLQSSSDNIYFNQ